MESYLGNRTQSGFQSHLNSLHPREWTEEVPCLVQYWYWSLNLLEIPVLALHHQSGMKSFLAVKMQARNGIWGEVA